MKKPTSLRSKRKPKSKLPARITNETIAEHRERILAGGRRFKYPVQYARHKLVFNAIIVVVAALVLFMGVLLWLLYSAQNTSNFTYRITQVVPFPVAKVDGTNVPYSNYLSYYNMSTYYLVNNEQFSDTTADGKSEASYIKRQSLDLAIENSYAKTLAGELSLSVSNDEVNKAIRRDKQTANGVISDDTYERSAQLFYNMSADDFERVMRDSILRKKVRFAVDKTAKSLVVEVEERIDKQGASTTLAKLAGGFDKESGVVGGVSAPVARASGADPVLDDIAKQQGTGKVYGPFETSLDVGEGYYFLKPTAITDKTIAYEYLYIPLHEFANQIEALRKDGQITEYIRIDS